MANDVRAIDPVAAIHAGGDQAVDVLAASGKAVLTAVEASGALVTTAGVQAVTVGGQTLEAATEGLRAILAQAERAAREILDAVADAAAEVVPGGEGR